MKLISEALEDVEFISEQADGKKSYKIKGVFMQAEIKNRNGRVYPMEVLETEVNKYNKKFINENRAYGELGHPDGPTVNLDRVSHMVTKLKKEGGKLGVSSRGMGSLEQKNGANYVKKDFMLASAADIVADPSAPNAFVQGIMEGKEWVWDNGLLKEVELKSIVEDIETNVRKKMPNVEALAFAKFLKKL